VFLGRTAATTAGRAGASQLGRTVLRKVGVEVAEQTFKQQVKKYGLKAAIGTGASMTVGKLTELEGPESFYDPDGAKAEADLDGNGEINEVDDYHLQAMQELGFEGTIQAGEGVGEIVVTQMSIDGTGNSTMDVDVPLDDEQARRKAAGEVWVGKTEQIPAISTSSKAMDYLNGVRAQTEPAASADFDADGDIDKTDAKHERKIHELGFEGQISHDKQGRPILSAMDMDGQGDSVSIQLDGGYVDYLEDIQKDGHEGHSH
jgi:hypothetical protein